MKTSESTAALAAALSKAQGAMSGAVKDRQNPHFKNDYATLSSVIEAARAALAANELSIVQGLFSAATGLDVTTRLMHSSGEWIEDSLVIPLSKADAQGMGSAATYGRRYALAAMLNIAQVDDDGNAAAERAPAVRSMPKQPGPDELLRLQELRDAAMLGMAPLKAAWKALSEHAREALESELPALKTAALAADASTKEAAA